MAEFRAALIGFGLAGSLFHGPLIAATPEISLATVVTGNRNRASQARAEHPGVRVEPRAEAVWERADEHEARGDRDSQRLACRARGTGNRRGARRRRGQATGVSTSVAARELVAHAERAGIPLTVFHNRRWDSDQLTLRRLMAEGSLGDIRRYESRFERWRPQLRRDAWRETTAPHEGGGVLLDLGTHLVDQALVLFGPVSRVYGESTSGAAARRTTTPFSLSSMTATFVAISGPRRSPERQARGCASSAAARPSSSMLSTARRMRSEPAFGLASPASGAPSLRLDGDDLFAANRASPFDQRTAPGRDSTSRLLWR